MTAPESQSSRLFVPGVVPTEHDDPLVIAFAEGGEVLVDAHGDALHPARAFAEAPLPAERYVGRVGGRPCYAISIAREATPGGTRWLGLRPLLLSAPSGDLGLFSSAAQIATWDLEHRFCARCGGPLQLRRGERAKACAPCRLSHYPRVSPCVIVLIHDGDRVLLGRRPDAPWYSLFAGFVEAGESLEEAAHREVLEETGATLGELHYFGSQTWPFPHQLMVGYSAPYQSGESVPDPSELAEASWFPVDALPPIPPPLSIAHKMITAWASSRRGA